jgi:phenylacetate-coenzyme A ligase PaaK-like adenylate-forming protein
MLHQFKKQLLVTPEMQLVDYGHLPRSERKSQRIFDKRLGDDVV